MASQTQFLPLSSTPWTLHAISFNVRKYEGDSQPERENFWKASYWNLIKFWIDPRSRD